MNLEQFAKKAGVTIIECDPEWGGLIGYKEKDHPNSATCGFRTTAAAYKHWLDGTFGKRTAKAIMQLLKSPNVQIEGQAASGMSRSNAGLGRWISVDDRMPPKEKYVFIHLTKNNWNDSSDSEGAVAMLLTGISKAEREALKSSVVEADLKRAKIYRSEDEWLNNLRPYCWDTFGLSKYFGQEVDFWMEIPPLCFN